MPQEMTGYPSIDKPWLKYYSREAIEVPPPPEGSLYDFVFTNNQGHLKNTALRYFSKRITYADLFQNITSVEQSLVKYGVKSGEIVTVNLPSTPEMVYILYACAKIGAIVNIIDPRSNADTIRQYLNEVESRIFIFLDQCGPLVSKAISGSTVKTAISVSAVESLKLLHAIRKKITIADAVTWKEFISQGRSVYVDKRGSFSGNEPVLITHTSGTTGVAKSVLLSHRSINALAYQYSVGMEYSRNQSYLCIIPPFVAFGDCVAIHLPLALGMTDVLIPSFDAQKLPQYLNKYKPAHFTCAPMSLEPLIQQNQNLDLSFLVTPAVGGDYIDIKFEEDINHYLKKCGCKHQLVKGYGMTEVSSSACTTSDYCNEAGSVGIPLAQMIISIFEIGTDHELTYREKGEICFTGPNVMLGYYKNPEATKEALRIHSDGKVWMHSGDIGYMTEEGHLFVIDRIARAITIDDNIIYPSEIEHVLMELPFVKKSSVIGHNNLIFAFVILRPESIDAHDAIEQMENIASKKLPSVIRPTKYVVCEHLPLTSVGKVDYRKLEELAAELN